MTVIFDGKAYAGKLVQKTKIKVNRLRKNGVVPKLVSIIVGDDPASVLYVNLKKKAAEQIGAEVEIVKLPNTVSMNRFIETINRGNKDNSVHGIMVQLPLPDNFSQKDRDDIINTIKPEKDVDGLRDDSPYLTPTAKAVLSVLAALEEAKQRAPLKVPPYKGRYRTVPDKVVVVGSTGFEGSKIMKALKEKGYEVEGANSETKNLKLKIKNSDIVVSATGVSGLIKKDMVKDGVVLIDVGSPKGDIEKEVYEKASFVSPVPGGIGPVTISCLLENLANSVYNSLS